MAGLTPLGCGKPSTSFYADFPIPSERHIRLITLHPGAKDDPINLTLDVECVDNRPNFAALSYVWGDSGVNRHVFIEEVKHEITVNLFEALRCFRRIETRYTLWVDAICIDQGNAHERNQQVRLMASIYTFASDVIVWLGRSSNNIHLAVAWVENYVKHSHPEFGRVWLPLEKIPSLSEEEASDQAMNWGAAAVGYYEIWSNPYWKRLWTYQEYKLPRKEPLCVYDEVTFRWGAEVQRRFDSLPKEAGDVLQAISDSRTDMETTALCTQFIRSMTRGSKKLVHETGHPNLSGSTGRILETGMILHMTALLCHTSRRPCKVPQDRFYALYGLHPGAEAASPPDYTCPVNKIWHEVAAYIVNHEGGLEGLFLALLFG